MMFSHNAWLSSKEKKCVKYHMMLYLETDSLFFQSTTCVSGIYFRALTRQLSDNV